jgi:hypothetical protein
MISTIAATQANSHAGTGRLALPEMPWALAAVGTSAPVAKSAEQIAATRRAAAQMAGPAAGLE